MPEKRFATSTEALDGLTHNDMTLAVGGFGLCGIPEQLIIALRDSGVTGLSAVSNNAGVDDWGLGLLLQSRQISKMVSSYVGENEEFCEAVPRRGTGTRVHATRHAGRANAGWRGRHSWVLHAHRRGHGGRRRKEHREFEGVTHILEAGIRVDLALVKAWKADEVGNLVYRKTARNFNPAVAMCGKTTVAEVEEIVPVGALDPDAIHTPGIFVDRIVQTVPERRIEQRTVTQLG